MPQICSVPSAEKLQCDHLRWTAERKEFRLFYHKTLMSRVVGRARARETSCQSEQDLNRVCPMSKRSSRRGYGHITM